MMNDNTPNEMPNETPAAPLAEEIAAEMMRDAGEAYAHLLAIRDVIRRALERPAALESEPVRNTNGDCMIEIIARRLRRAVLPLAAATEAITALKSDAALDAERTKVRRTTKPRLVILGGQMQFVMPVCQTCGAPIINKEG